MVRRILQTTFLVALTLLSTSLFAQQQFDDYKRANGTFVMPLPQEKLDQIGKIDELPSNLDATGIEFKEDQYQYFRIANTNEMLVVKSLQMIRKEYELNKLEH